MRLSQIPVQILFENIEDLDEGLVGSAVNKELQRHGYGSKDIQRSRDQIASHIKTSKKWAKSDTAKGKENTGPQMLVKSVTKRPTQIGKKFARHQVSYDTRETNPSTYKRQMW